MTTSTNDDVRVWTIHETAQALRVSRRTVYRLIADGEIRRVKIGSLARVRRSSVLEYVLRQQHLAVPGDDPQQPDGEPDR